MKPSTLALVLVCAAFSASAAAHAHLHASVPADHATVSAAPRQLSLAFNESVVLTALTIQKGDSAPTRLGPLADAGAAEFKFELPSLDDGSYVVKWRAISADGHIMAGKFTFTVRSAAP